MAHPDAALRFPSAAWLTNRAEISLSSGGPITIELGESIRHRVRRCSSSTTSRQQSGSEQAVTIGVDDSGARRAVELELHVEFPAVPLDQVTILVACLWAHFDNAPVRDFVPLLVRKQAKEELRDHIGPPADAAVSPAEPRAQARPRSTPLLLEGSAP